MNRTVLLFSLLSMFLCDDDEKPEKPSFQEMSPLMRQRLLDISEGREDISETPEQFTEEELEKLIDETPADEVPADFLEPTTVREVEPSDLVCNGCLWTGRLVRSALTLKI